MLSVVPVLVVLDQSDRVVAFRDDSVETLEAEEAGGLVHVDGNIVKTRRLPRDLQALFVEFEGLGELLLLQVVVGLFAVLLETNSAELLLHFLLSEFDGSVLAVKHHGSVEVLLRQLELLFQLVAFRSSLQEFDLQNVVLLELFGVRLEAFDKLQGLVRPDQAVLVVLSLQIDHADIGESVLVRRVDRHGLSVVLQSLIQLIAGKGKITSQLDFLRLLPLFDLLDVVLNLGDVDFLEEVGVLHGPLQVNDGGIVLRVPGLCGSTPKVHSSKHLVVVLLVLLSFLLLQVVDLAFDIGAVVDRCLVLPDAEEGCGSVEATHQEVLITFN